METIEVARKKSIRRLVGLALIVIVIVVGAVLVNNFLNNKPLQIFEDNSVEGKAKKAGYELAWVGDKEEKTGRTVLAKGRRSEELLEDKFFWTMETDENLKLMAPVIGMGTFKEWQDIKGSSDKYLVLENPFSKSEKDKTITARIVFEKTEIGSSAGRIEQTQLSVENLDYGFKNQNIPSSMSIGAIADINVDTLGKIIKKGDIISIYTIFLGEKERKETRKMILLDNFNKPFVGSIMIRRFGGKEQIEKEMSK